MSSPRFAPAPRALSRAAVLSLALLAAACGDDSDVGKTYPVSGKVLLNGEPLVAKTTTILLKPDTAKGNTTSFEPAASVDSSGNYTVFTKKKRGAPPGWYKVIVTATATESPAPASKRPLKQRPLPESLVPGKYAQAATTPLQIEVVESPAAGAYDLVLTK
jgi:hypothetical protein